MQRTKDDQGRTVLVDAATGKAGVITRDGLQPLSSADTAALDTSKMRPATTNKAARTFPGGPAAKPAAPRKMPTGTPTVARTWTGK